MCDFILSLYLILCLCSQFLYQQNKLDAAEFQQQNRTDQTQLHEGINTKITNLLILETFPVTSCI